MRYLGKGCVGVGRWTHHNPDAVGAGSVHGFDIGSGAGGAFGAADWGVVALDACSAVGSGACVEVRGVGGGADPTLMGELTAFLTVTGPLAPVALGAASGGRTG